MNQILDGIDSVVTAISGVLYMPWVPLLLLAAGLFFTFRSKFIQIRLLGESFRVVSEKPKTKGSISSFGALMISTASRVGTGNIVGVSTAICLGGYGAVFWMWVTAILGGASAFVESTLAQIYKRKNKDGSSYGGPSYYMETALRQRWLGVVFAIIIILTYAVGYNMLASYNLQSAFAGFSFYGDHSHRPDPGGSLCRLRAGRRPPSDQSHRHTGSHHGRSLRCHCLGRGSDAPEPGPHRLPEHFCQRL